jgi:hypothetical protein
MSRTLRYVRITFSAMCAIACVLLCVLWVRSYWWLDELKGKPLKGKLTASSVSGKLVFEGGSAPSKFLEFITHMGIDQ